MVNGLFLHGKIIHKLLINKMCAGQNTNGSNVVDTHFDIAIHIIGRIHNLLLTQPTLSSSLATTRWMAYAPDLHLSTTKIVIRS